MKIKIPDGEGLKELVRRVKNKLFFILSRCKGDTLAIVTHGGPIRVILCEAMNSSLDAFWQIEQNIGALNIIDYSEKLVAEVVKINDTSHLF